MYTKYRNLGQLPLARMKQSLGLNRLPAGFDSVAHVRKDAEPGWVKTEKPSVVLYSSLLMIVFIDAA